MKSAGRISRKGKLAARRVMTIEELGLDPRTGTDRVILAFAQYAEARIGKWIQFPRGVLLFLTVPGDPESGWFYLLDRAHSTFYSLDIAEEGRWGGYREDEFARLTQSFGLVRLAQRPSGIGARSPLRF